MFHRQCHVLRGKLLSYSVNFVENYMQHALSFNIACAALFLCVMVYCKRYFNL